MVNYSDMGILFYCCDVNDLKRKKVAEIFKEELDRLGIPYHYDLDVESKFEPLMPDEPVLKM